MIPCDICSHVEHGARLWDLYLTLSIWQFEIVNAGFDVWEHMLEM